MNKKEQIRKERQRQEDAALVKILYWIVGSVVLEILLLLLNRYYVDYLTVESEIMLALRLNSILPGLAVVGLIIFAGCTVKALSNRKAGKNTGMFTALAVFFLMVGISCIIARVFHDTGIHFLYIAVPVIAVLALVYYLYQHEFFAIAVLSTLGILAVWMAAHKAGASRTVVYGYFAVLAVVLILTLIFAHKMQAQGGKLTVKEKKVEIFPNNANYVMLYITCAVVAAVAIVALVVGALPFLYGIAAVWLLIMAVYYTVRLM